MAVGGSHLPGTQGVHRLAPARAYEPEAQATQATWPLRKKPAGQTEQIEAALPENCPAGHLLQSSDLVLGAYVPGGHATHADWLNT